MDPAPRAYADLPSDPDLGRPVPFAALLATFDRHHHHTREAVAS